jgi:deoxyribodipyrimidine photo-lyase
MWFASIWIFTLRLPWELGADFFLRHLLDGDPASNTLSWRWVGGLQTAGKTYLARPDNIFINTGGRFRPEGLATEAAALAAPPAPAPRPLPEPEKLDPGAPSVLVLHEDDLSPGFILERGLNLVGTALIAAPEGRSPLVVAPGVVRFVRQAVQTAAELHSARLGVVRPLTEGDTAAAMTAWARELGADQIVTAYAPVGPTAQRLRDLKQACHDQGIGFVRCLREEDRTLWPLATHGFFRFWEAASAA